MKGKIKWYSGTKGYGYATGEDGKDYFVHFSEIKTDEDGRRPWINEEQDLEFDPAETDKGPRALNIEVL